MNIFLVELKGYNSATTSEETLRFATRQLGDFEERLARAGFVRRDMFANGTTFGRSRPSFGDIELVNSALLDAEGDLDYLNEWAFDGRDISVYWGPSDGTYPDGFTLLYAATMEAVLVARDRVTIKLLGNAARVDLPLRDEFYAGIGGATGDSSLRGKPLPYAFGRVQSISPVLINTEYQAYQVHSGAVSALTVYDDGEVITEGTGIDFSARTSPTTAVSRHAYSDTGVGIIVSGDDVYETLDKGLTWTEYTAPLADMDGVQEIAATSDYESGGVVQLLRRFVAVGYTNDPGPFSPIMYSDQNVTTLKPDPSAWNGTNLDWTSGQTTGFQARSVCYSPELGRTLVVGFDTANSGLLTYQTADGVPSTFSGGASWGGDSIDSGSSPQYSTGDVRCAWLGGSRQVFIVAGRGDVNASSQSYVYTSPDGSTWTKIYTGSPSFFFELSPLVYDETNDVIIATELTSSTDFNVVSSADGGVTWSSELSGLVKESATRALVAHIPTVGSYVTHGSGAVDYSPDGLTWSTISADTGLVNRYGLIAFGGFLLAFTDSSDYARGYGPDNYLELSDIFDPDSGAAAGEYKIYPAGGIFRLGSSATGTITADVTVQPDAEDRTAAQAFVAVMDELGTTFVPDQLFAAGEMGVWIDPADDTTVFQDAAATTPAGDGDPVGCILDKSGNDLHATQSTSTARPIRRLRNGTWTLEFDGVDDFLTVGSMGFTGTEDFRFFVGAERDSSGATMYFWNMGLSGFSTSYPGMSIGPQDFSNYVVRLWMSDGVTSATRTAGQWGNTGRHIMSLDRTDNRIDQVRQGWASTITQSFAGQQTRNRIGCRDVGFARQNFFKGWISQLAFVLPGTTTDERLDTEQFIGRRMDFDLPTPGDPPYYDDLSVTALDAIAPYEVGFFLDTQEVIAARVLDDIANSVGAYWGDGTDGIFRIAQIDDPANATSVATVRDYDMTAPLERLRTQDLGRGVPFWRTAIQYARRYTTVSNFGAAVTDAERLRQSTEYDVESYEDSGIRLVHPLSQELILPTLLQDSTDAIAEAVRIWDLRSVKRDYYDFGVKLDAASVAWDVGDAITIEHPRFGLSSGKQFWIIGLQLNPRPQTVTVQVWG